MHTSSTSAPVTWIVTNACCMARSRRVVVDRRTPAAAPCARTAERAGTAAQISAMVSVTPTAKAKTRRSNAASSMRGKSAGPNWRHSDRPAIAMPAPARPPAAESTSDSSTSCRSTCRRDAPSDARTANSGPRATERTISRLARLPQPIACQPHVARGATSGRMGCADRRNGCGGNGASTRHAAFPGQPVRTVVVRCGVRVAGGGRAGRGLRAGQTRGRIQPGRPAASVSVSYTRSR